MVGVRMWINFGHDDQPGAGSPGRRQVMSAGRSLLGRMYWLAARRGVSGPIIGGGNAVAGCGGRSSVGAVSVAAPALAGATVRLAGRELLVLGSVVTVVPLGVADRYGPHRDELYFCEPVHSRRGDMPTSRR
jgi:hypothetical protein